MNEPPYCTYYKFLLNFICMLQRCWWLILPCRESWRANRNRRVRVRGHLADNGTQEHSSLAFYPITVLLLFPSHSYCVWLTRCVVHCMPSMLAEVNIWLVLRTSLFIPTVHNVNVYIYMRFSSYGTNPSFGYIEGCFQKAGVLHEVVVSQ